MMKKATAQLFKPDLARRQALFTSIVEASQYAIISKDLNGMITSWNQSAERILGYAESEVIGKHISLIIPTSNSGTEDAIISSILKGKKDSHFNTILKTKSGKEIDVSLAISPIYNSEKKIIGVSEILQDISDQVAMERKIMNTNRALQRSNIYKDELIGILAHELRTPLTSLKLSLELAIADTSGRDALLIKAKLHSDRLAQMLEELLDVAQLQAGRLEIHCKRVNVHEFVTNAIEAVQRTHPSHKIIYAAASPIWVEADALRMEQVVMNLLTNAIKYSPGKNEVVVEVDVAGKSVEIRVKDFGLGIPDMDQKKIWMRFYRVAAHKLCIKGLGVGLHLCRQLILAHKGSIWVESQEDKGSTFYVRLPCLK
ncbi:MAG: PAS domain S-box protein [Chitinophagaceae bacterium]|nr:PAS domain S-box protein [Chitinophagaceae bacterium]